jgi:hypothetical protein
LSDNEKGATPTIKSGPLNLEAPYVRFLPTAARDFTHFF